MPENYGLFISDQTKLLLKKPKEARNYRNFPIGVTCYENFFSNEELADIEQEIEKTEAACSDGAFLPMTA